MCICQQEIDSLLWSRRKTLIPSSSSHSRTLIQAETVPPLVPHDSGIVIQAWDRLPRSIHCCRARSVLTTVLCWEENKGCYHTMYPGWLTNNIFTAFLTVHCAELGWHWEQHPRIPAKKFSNNKRKVCLETDVSASLSTNLTYIVDLNI